MGKLFTQGWYDRVEALLALLRGQLASSVVHWANDLATSTTLHQWVSGLSGANGAGGPVALRTQATIEQTQGGTPLAPTIERSFLVQPQPDPVLGTKAPFGTKLYGALSQGLFDAVWFVGYNPDFGTAPFDLEPSVGVSIEQCFKAAPASDPTTEFHLVSQTAVNPGPLISTRFLTMNMSRASGNLTTGIGWCGINPADATVAGEFYVYESSTGTKWIDLHGQNSNPATGPVDYYAAGPTPSHTGAVRLPIANAQGIVTGVSFRSKTDAYDIAALWMNQIDELFLGLVQPAGGGNPRGVEDIVLVTKVGGFVGPRADNDTDLGFGTFRWRNVFSGAIAGDSIAIKQTNLTQQATLDTNVSGCRFYPSTDNTGSIGLGTNRWALIRGTVVTSGDLELVDEERAADWLLREQQTFILAVNRRTGEKRKIATEPLTTEDEAELARNDPKWAAP